MKCSYPRLPSGKPEANLKPVRRQELEKADQENDKKKDHYKQRDKHFFAHGPVHSIWISKLLTLECRTSHDYAIGVNGEKNNCVRIV